MKVQRMGRSRAMPTVTPPAPVRDRPTFRIADAALAEAMGDGAPASPYELPKIAPGVVPAGVNMALDSSQSLQAAYGWANQYAIFHEGLQFMGYPYLAELTQRAEYRKPAEILAKEMTRKWIKLQATGEEDKTEKITKLEAEMKRLNMRGVIRKAAEIDGFMGRSQIFIDTGYGLDDRDEIATPLALTKEKIGLNSLKRLTVVEPMWTYPSTYNSTNPLAPDFFKPTSWYVMSASVHASRLLTVIGRPLPDILKPAYAFGGLSLSQMAKPYIDNWLRTRQSVSDIIHAFSVMVLKTNMGAVLNGGVADQLRKRAQLFTQMRDNRGLFILDKDSEEFENVSAPLSSLDALQGQSQEQMSAVTGIPLSILLGITPKGLNASNDGEIRTFYAWVEAQQESMLTPSMNYLLQVMQLSLFGEIDPQITFMWEPLWAMSEKERAEIRKSEAETDAIYVNEIGSISSQESRQRLAQQEDSPYASLDLDAMPVPPADDEDEMNDLVAGAGNGGEGGQARPAQ